MKLSKTKKEMNSKNNVKVRKVIAFVLSFFTMVLLLSELAAFTMYAVPMIGIQMFQMTGISVEAGLTLSSFTVSDASVMFMMWILPCIFFTGIGIYVHCKLIKIVCRKLFVWCRVIFARTPTKSQEKD